VASPLELLDEVVSDFPLATSDTQSPIPWWPWVVAVEDAELERIPDLHDDTAEVTAEP